MRRPGRVVLLAMAWLAAGLGLAQDAQPPVELYDRDPDQPLNAELEVFEESEDWIVHHALYDSTNGERVPALLGLPKTGEEPFPVVMVQHGLTGHKNVDYVRVPALALAQAGYATLRIDAQYHGERAREQDREAFWELLVELAQQGGWIQSIVDMRRGLDFLETREDIDSDRLGYVGVSMGAIMGGVLCGVDERIDAAALLLGGSMGAILPGVLENIDPANFIKLFSPRPLLMMNGKNDPLVPAAAAQRLYDAALEPKRIIWYDTGHTVPPEEAVKEVIAFMAERVPVEDAGNH